eukprot:635099-Rhodomonas_salina.2
MTARVGHSHAEAEGQTDTERIIHAETHATGMGLPSDARRNQRRKSAFLEQFVLKRGQRAFDFGAYLARKLPSFSRPPLLRPSP